MAGTLFPGVSIPPDEGLESRAVQDGYVLWMQDDYVLWMQFPDGNVVLFNGAL